MINQFPNLYFEYIIFQLKLQEISQKIWKIFHYPVESAVETIFCEKNDRLPREIKCAT